MTKKQPSETTTIIAAAKRLRIGRNQAYEAARNGQIPVIRIGRRLLVPTAALACCAANLSLRHREKKAARFARAAGKDFWAFNDTPHLVLFVPRHNRAVSDPRRLQNAFLPEALARLVAALQRLMPCSRAWPGMWRIQWPRRPVF
jgi:excisionase family DNA binding protein